MEYFPSGVQSQMHYYSAHSGHSFCNCWFVVTPGSEAAVLLVLAELTPVLVAALTVPVAGLIQVVKVAQLVAAAAFVLIPGMVGADVKLIPGSKDNAAAARDPKREQQEM